MDAIMLVTQNATHLYPLLLPSVMNCVLIIRFVTSKQLNITLLKHMHSLQPMNWTSLVDWTGGLHWWTDAKIILWFLMTGSPAGLHDDPITPKTKFFLHRCQTDNNF